MTEKEIKCEQALRQVLAYVDRELDEREHSAMQRHLHVCKSCYSRMEFERRLKRKVGELRDEEVPTRLGERIKGLLQGF